MSRFKVFSYVVKKTFFLLAIQEPTEKPLRVVTTDFYQNMSVYMRVVWPTDYLSVQNLKNCTLGQCGKLLLM